MRLIFVALIAIFSLPGMAQNPSSAVIFTFKEWKDSQILQSQNEVVRLSNRIQLIKTGRYKVEESPKPANETALPSGVKRDQSQKDLQASAERELKRSLESLQYAKELTMDEYASVYLSQFKDQPEVIGSLTGKMSKEDMAELLKATLKANSPSLGESVTPEVRAKSVPLVGDGSVPQSNPTKVN